MATIFLTGVTGVVGSRLACLLRQGGHRLICLVRGKSAPMEMNGDILWVGDVTLPLCGVGESKIASWKGKVDKLVHCAASVKFDEKSAEMTRKTNVEGTANVLALSHRLGILQIHHVSTAYVAGDADYFREKDFDVCQRPRNVYEQTKKIAEEMVRSWPYARHSIHRLGIVVGDSVTGFIPSFNGYYGFLGSIHHLRQSFAAMSEADRKKYEAEGFTVDAEGLLNLPIYGNFSPVSTLNLVPLDWTAGILRDLIELEAVCKVFHIVDPNPKRIRWINDVSMRVLGVKGFMYGNNPGYDPKSLLGRFQRIFDRGTAQYASYISHEAKFSTENMFRALRGQVPFFSVDEDFVALILNYAKSVNFGKK